MLSTAGVVLFFGGAAITFALLINLSSNWCGLLKKWEQVEGYFGHQKNLKLKFTFISVLCIIFSIGEAHLVSNIQLLQHSVFYTIETYIGKYIYLCLLVYRLKEFKSSKFHNEMKDRLFEMLITFV